ncbi:MAG: hypothetical protein ACXWQQ_07500 [Pseudobdellovibrio sp.]
MEYLKGYFNKSDYSKKQESKKLQKLVEIIGLHRGEYVEIKPYGIRSILGFIFIRAPYFMADLTWFEQTEYISNRFPQFKKIQNIERSALGLKKIAVAICSVGIRAFIFCYKLYSSVSHAFNKVFKFYDPGPINEELSKNSIELNSINDRDVRIKRFREFQLKNVSKKIADTFSDEVADFMSWRDLKTFKDAISQFDIVQGYSYDGIWPLVVGFSPYVAFEHGTIRTLPFENSIEGQMTKLAYTNADYVVITNADNIVAAKRLGLEKYKFIPHPICEVSDSDLKSITNPVDIEKGVFYVFGPARHQWDENPAVGWGMQKGNHFIIKAFAEFLKINPKSKLIFVNFGIDIEKSKNLIRSLNIETSVIWIEPVEEVRLAKLMSDVDVVVDQFRLGAFGAIPARVLFSKKPLITNYDEELHSWCFKEHPPFFRAKNSDEILFQLTKIYQDRAYRDDYVKRGYEWYLKYHSSEVILESHLEIYEKILKATGKL